MVAKKNIWNNWQLSLLIFFGALFILLFNAPQCLAGYVVADVDRASGTTDDQFVVTVVVNGKLKGEPSFPNVPGLKVVGTSKQSKGSLDVMRGSLNTELQFVFVVSPERTGTFTIPPFVLTVDGKEETTAELAR